MAVITDIRAREILDSRGNPTIEVTIAAGRFIGTAAVPSGASTGEHEAIELRDGGKRYNGLGVKKAVQNVHTKIAPLLKGIECTRQREIDSLMIEKDGYQSKSRLGANAMLAVSLACSRVAAASKGLLLFQHLNQFTTKKTRLPQPFMNVINGGKHADNKLSFQEFMIVPTAKSFTEMLRMGVEVYHILEKELHKKYGVGATNVGDEGGFAPAKLKKTADALKMLTKAIRDAGYKGKVHIAIDAAASEFYKNGKYYVDGKKISKEQLTEYYLDLIRRYPVISIEDPFDEDDYESFAHLREKSKIQIVGDDLTVTNSERIEAAVKDGSCNCLLLKVNQIGTLSEAINAARMAYDAGWNVMVSHRSGDTEDSFIADLAVGLGSGMIKSGAPCRGERTAKYNQLLRIEEFMKRK